MEKNGKKSFFKKFYFQKEYKTLFLKNYIDNKKLFIFLCFLKNFPKKREKIKEKKNTFFVYKKEYQRIKKIQQAQTNDKIIVFLF